MLHARWEAFFVLRCEPFFVLRAGGQPRGSGGGDGVLELYGRLLRRVAVIFEGACVRVHMCHV